MLRGFAQYLPWRILAHPVARSDSAYIDPGDLLQGMPN